MDELDIPSIIKGLGGAEEIRKGLEKFKVNIDFYRQNHSSFLERYPNKWIAIQEERVAATSRSLDGLMRTLDRKKIDRKSCYVQFLDPNPKPQILAAIQARVSLAFFILQN